MAVLVFVSLVVIFLTYLESKALLKNGNVGRICHLDSGNGGEI